MKILQIQNELHNRSQSWWYESIWRTTKVDHDGMLFVPKQVRVEIRCGAYEDQAHAKVSVWTGEGWAFYTEIPTHDWYADAPSYVTKREKLLVKHLLMFSRIEETLLQTWVRGTFGPTRGFSLEYLPDDRREHCTGSAQPDGTIQHDGESCPIHEG